MPTRASLEVRETRKRALAPLFDYMTARGTHRSWLARQLEISVARVWNYEHGYNTPPEWFVARACKALGVSPRKLGLTVAKSSRTTSSTSSQASATRAQGSTDHVHGTSTRPIEQKPAQRQQQPQRQPSRRTAASRGSNTPERADPAVASRRG